MYSCVSIDFDYREVSCHVFVCLVSIFTLSTILYSSLSCLATARLVIGTSRTVGSAKKFVRITSGFGGGEFTKTLRKVLCSIRSDLLKQENEKIDSL
jgi:hypothetical protein